MELLRKDSYLTSHRGNLKLLVTEMFEIKIRFAPNIMKKTFDIDNEITTSGMTF